MRRLIIREAPADWLLQAGLVGIDERVIMLLLVWFSWMGGLMMHKGHVIAASVFGTIVMIISTAFFARRWCTPRTFEKVLQVQVTLVGCLCIWALVDAHDPIFRHRAMSLTFVFSKTTVLLLGFRFVPSCFMLLVMGINDVLGTWHLTTTFGENPDLLLRLPGLVLFMSAIHLVAVAQQHGRWCMLYETQESLTNEKSAMESLLSMICDASFWLSKKGNCVSRSNPHLDSMMGQEMVGIDISQMMKDDERDKFLNTLALPGMSAVTLFRTSLVMSSSLRVMEVELFVVDRRSTTESRKPGDSEETCRNLDAMGFLVGLRLYEPFAIEPFESHTEECTSIAPSMLKQTLNHNSEPGHQNRFELLDNHLPPNVTKDAVASLAAEAVETPFVRPSVLHVSFSDDVSDTGSSSSRPSSIRSALKKSTASVDACIVHRGPVRGLPYQESGAYLKECSLSLMEDLVSSWNFDVQGCCAWHANLKLLGEMLQSLKSLHSCSEKWQVEVTWQCRSCMALLGPGHPDDSCWLCYEPREADLQQ